MVLKSLLTAVTSFIGTYFDVNKKVGVNMSADKGTWVNFYARYVSDSNELSCFYYVDREDSRGNAIEYFPTENEQGAIHAIHEWLASAFSCCLSCTMF